MNENAKTFTFLGVAAAFAALAYFTGPEDLRKIAQASKKGLELFTFSATETSGIEVVEMSAPENGPAARRSIEVAEKTEGWYVQRPRFSYPADAKGKVGRMATSLAGLRIHDLESDKQGDHAKHGVLDPADAGEVSQAEGDANATGKRLTIKKGDSTLAALIIGKKHESDEGLRYVREPGKSEVYSVKFDDYDDLSTKFVDWVEKDFLDLDKWDVKRVTLDNYEVETVPLPNGRIGKRIKSAPQHVLDYESSEWKLSGSPLAENEELDKDKLDSLKDALDDLRIIDVEPKSAPLASSLKTGNEFVDAATLNADAGSLESKGFHAANELDAAGNPRTDAAGRPMHKVVPEQGEIRVGMKDGVEYVLRFGDVYGGPEGDENATGDSRYLYAFARVNPALLDPPDLEIVPPSLPDTPAPTVEPGTPANEANATTAPAPEGNATAPGNEGDEGEPGSAGPESNATSAPEGNTEPPPPPGPPPSFTPPSAPPSAPPPAPPPAAIPAPDANATADTNATAPDPAAEYAKKRAEREADIARIRAANATKQKDFDDKLAKAQKRVNELNQRLADWYYVIDNKEYEKIRLDRPDFVKQKPKEDANATSGDRPALITASHVLVAYKDVNPEVTRTKEEAKALAGKLRKQIIDEGRDFAEVARENSDGPNGPNGGDLGEFSYERMTPPFSEAAFALEVGGVSEVVETTFGFHVIKRTK